MTLPLPLTRALIAACLAAIDDAPAADDATTTGQSGKAAAKSATDLIRKQGPPVIVSELAAKVTSENCRIVVNLANQRACLLAGNDVYIDTPISSGKASAPTRAGTFAILEKIPEHRSTMYGHFVDKRGQIVRAGVSMKLDAAPAGTRYADTPMRFFCRFNDAGSGIHGGILPGYPAAHGSIRVPEDIAKLIYEKVKVGTPVEIRAE